MDDARADSGGRPTIRDVARRAGVSVGTVSNVLNRRIPVSDQRRAAVDEAIAALGFVPNRNAQSLRGRSWRVVGLVVHDTKSAYFAAMLDRFETMGGDLGYEVMQVLNRGEPEIELRRTRALIERQVDGLILVPTVAPQATFDLIADSGVPAVMIDRGMDDPRFDYVTMDNDGAMTDLVHALAARGRKDVRFVVRWPELVTTRQRMAALAREGTKAGIATATLVRDPEDAIFAGQIRDLMDRPGRPDAIVASNSIIAEVLLTTLAARGTKIPDEISVVAFDEPDWAELTTPPLSVVRHPIEQIAQSAWDILIDRIENGTPPGRRVVHPARVVLRGSVKTD
jgi:LacI family transcriptional regulator